MKTKSLEGKPSDGPKTLRSANFYEIITNLKKVHTLEAKKLMMSKSSLIVSWNIIYRKKLLERNMKK